jgi:biopolymer transport protein ExbD
MPLRKKKRHIQEVNMSSMTDIVFMLLIFFMLTSTMVRFFGYKLPESGQRTNASIKTTVNVYHERTPKGAATGRFVFSVNEEAASSIDNLGALLKAAIAKAADRADPVVTIAAEFDVPFEEVVRVMTVANGLGVKIKKTTIATNPKE